MNILVNKVITYVPVGLASEAERIICMVDRLFVKVNVMPTSGRNNSYPKFKNLFKRPQIVNAKGFTLIELLVVVALIGILSIIILANYNSFGARQQVRDAAADFKSELRKYQNFAISGQKNPLTAKLTDTNCVSESETLERYVVVIFGENYPNVNVKSSYIVALDCAGFEIISDPAITRISNNNNIIISDVGSGGLSCSGDILWINFRPLNRGVDFICNGNPTSIYIRISNGTIEHEITVTQTGEINVEKL